MVSLSPNGGVARLSGMILPLMTVVDPTFLVIASPSSLHNIATLSLAENVALALNVLLDRENDFTLPCVALSSLTQRLALRDKMSQVTRAHSPGRDVFLRCIGQASTAGLALNQMLNLNNSIWVKPCNRAV